MTKPYGYEWKVEIVKLNGDDYYASYDARDIAKALNALDDDGWEIYHIDQPSKKIMKIIVRRESDWRAKP